MDRNFDTMQIVVVIMKSLSARRAWIEILQYNALKYFLEGRSPQGERG